MNLDPVSIVRMRAPLIVGVAAAIGVLSVVVGLIRPRTYDGTVVVSPVTSRASMSGASLAASVLGANGLGGLQSTPVLVARLARLDGVLIAVGSVPDDSGRRYVDRLRNAGPGRVNDRSLLETMRTAVSASADLQSGLVTIRVSARDSGLVRQMTAKLLDETSAAFVNATRAQASAMKHAQDLRVDSAGRRLSVAEEAQRHFLEANRTVGRYSEASITEQRLERELRTAETGYSQAVTDRESAAARELEATPALIVLDALPKTLLPRSRGLLLGAVLWSTLTGVIVMLALLAQAQFHGQSGAARKRGDSLDGG